MCNLGHLSLRDHTGALLQYARNRYFNTSFLLSRSRYVHLVTLEIVSEVLHVPRVAHPDYPSCNHLRTVSKDKLSSLFVRHFFLGVTIKTPFS